MSNEIKVMVAIPTYRRPESVERLLDLAVSQGWSTMADIVVLDNDPEQSAARIRSHSALKSGRYLSVPEPGVSAVRNAALERAIRKDVDYLIFLDDDMSPVPRWFEALIAAASRFTADLVLGRIVQPAEVLSQHHARAALIRDTQSTTGPYEGDLSGGNLLIRGDFLRNTGLRFDPRFGGLGGEDTYFGRLAVRQGARLVYCREAVVMERNPVSGTTRTALMRRAFNNGRSLTQVQRVLEEGEHFAYRLFRWTLATGFYSTKLAGATIFHRPEEMWQHIFSLSRNLGKLYTRSPMQAVHYRGINHREGTTRSSEAPYEMISIGRFWVADLTTSSVVEKLVSMGSHEMVRIAYALHVGGLSARGRRDYVDALTRGDLVYADGIAVVLLGRLAGARRLERSSTTDIVGRLLHHYAKVHGRRPRVALIGGPEGLAATAGLALSSDESCSVVLTHSGYPSEWSSVLRSLRKVAPDIVLLGLGSPFEVTLSDEYREEFPASLVLTCGGLFGFLTGQERRAPGWARRAGLEWVWRLTQDPGRLASRYAVGFGTVLRLSMAVLSERIKRRGRRLGSPA